MSKRITNVILGWSGTALNDLAVTYWTVKKVFEAHELEIPSLGTYRSQIAPDQMESFYWKYGIPRHIDAEAIGTLRLAFLQERGEKPRFFPRISEAVVRLKNFGIPTHIVTSENEDVMFHCAAQYALSDHFGFILLDAWDRSVALQSLSEPLNGDLAHAVYVDDCAEGIAAAKSLGMPTVGVIYGHQTEQRIRAAKPDVVAHNPRIVERVLLELAGIKENRISA